MTGFDGFNKKDFLSIEIPANFFSELLPSLEDPAEIKTILYFFWFISQQEISPVPYILHSQFLQDKIFLAGLGNRPEKTLERALTQAVEHLAFLMEPLPALNDFIYVLNTHKGKSVIEAIREGKWRPDDSIANQISLEIERPNIFRLYEENIGPLTPIISEKIQDAEKIYPINWIERAIRIAVENNVRRWRYIEAILQSWQKEGQDGTHRRTSSEDRKRYVEGEFSDFIKH